MTVDHEFVILDLQNSQISILGEIGAYKQIPPASPSPWWIHQLDDFKVVVLGPQNPQISILNKIEAWKQVPPASPSSWRGDINLAISDLQPLTLEIGEYNGLLPPPHCSHLGGGGMHSTAPKILHCLRIYAGCQKGLILRCQKLLQLL